MKRSITIKQNDTTFLKVTVSGSDPEVIEKTRSAIHEAIFGSFNVGELIRKKLKESPNPSTPPSSETLKSE